MYFHTARDWPLSFSILLSYPSIVISLQAGNSHTALTGHETEEKYKSVIARDSVQFMGNNFVRLAYHACMIVFVCSME
jgi:hypothetical protein